MRRRDIGEGATVVQVRGTKNEWRSRPVTVEAWARPYLVALCANLLPDAPLFGGMEYAGVRKQHKAALKACKRPKGYTLHDARHSYAVRQMQAGTGPNLVACNLEPRRRLASHARLREAPAQTRRLWLQFWLQ